MKFVISSKLRERTRYCVYRHVYLPFTFLTSSSICADFTTKFQMIKMNKTVKVKYLGYGVDGRGFESR
jgi:hypothetical protein